MSNIVIDAREINSTTGRYISKLLDNLQLLDAENEYRILLHPETMEVVSVSATNFRKVEVSQRKFTFAEQLLLGRKIRSLHPDLVHFTMANQPVFYRGKVVTTIHDLTPIRMNNDPSGSSMRYKLRESVYSWLTKKVVNRSKALITPTDFVKKDIVDFTGVDSKKIMVTYEAADKITAKPELVDGLIGKKFIFYTGRAHPHKNLARLVQAFENINSPDVLLVFSGKISGNYEALQKLVKQSSLDAKIIFTDFVSEAQLRWLYENAVAYIFPSLSEGFGLPGLEAMVHGCPVASSNATCLPEVYGQAAHYFDPLDVDDMAQKITEVIENENLRKDLIKKGHQQAAKYSWKRMAEQTLEVYKKVLN